MPNILINSPSGEQKIISIGAGGFYYDRNSVLWDETIDGEMPPVTLGKMQRVGNGLVTLTDYLPAHASAVYAESVPEYVPMPAAREALLNAGLLDAVTTFIRTLPTADQIWWDESISINRKFSLVENARVALGLTEKQIDDLFIAAKVINEQRTTY